MNRIYMNDPNFQQNALSRFRLLTTMLGILLLTVSCVDREVREYELGEPCFTKESLKSVPWIVNELKQYQVPKSGGYQVSIRIYHGQQFLSVENPLVSSPMSHIFNCEGVTISDLGINYNEFYENSELVAVLANEGNPL